MPTILGKQVGPIGFGMMGLTLFADKKGYTTEQAIVALKAALDNGANLWNGGEIYGTQDYNSLHLLNAYFTKYPEDAEKVIISIKGSYTVGGLGAGGHPDGSVENINRSIDECLRVLDGKKTLDIFELSRVDPNVPIETSLKAVNEYVKSGKLGGISLSEVNANSIRRAAKVVKVECVETEVSLFSRDIFEIGIAATCAELNIPIIGYSPIGRGMLSGQYKKPEEISPFIAASHMPRQQGEAFYQNLKLVEAIEQLAKQKGVTAAQIAIAWVKSLSQVNGNPTIIPIPGASSEARVKENLSAANINFSKEELDSIEDILNKHEVSGQRYPDAAMKYNHA